MPFAYLGIALLCVRQWRTDTPWCALDGLACGYFGLATVLILYHAWLKRYVTSCEALREASGLTYDPKTIWWGLLLAIADLLVFLDYGRWHLVPFLRWPLLRIMGIVLYLFAISGLMWTDTILAHHFQLVPAPWGLITTGPYAIVRHPRYACLLLSRVAFTLIFASVIGWLLLFPSVLLIRRRIRLEEVHLQQVFGSEYLGYGRHKSRLLPGIY